MPVYKGEKGTYYVKFRRKDPVSGKLKQITKRGFEKKKDAAKWESENKFTSSSSTSATFWDLFQQFLDNNDTSKDTRRKKEVWITMYFSEFKDMPIDGITKAMLTNWRNDLKNKGIAVRTMNCGLQYVRSVFGFYSTVYGGENVGAILKSFKLTAEDKTEMQIWKPDEFNRFLEEVRIPVYKAFFSFLYWTGCRRGEAIALCKEDIVGNKVRIRRSMKKFEGGFRPLKTSSSIRTITIDDDLLEVIRPFIAEADPFVFGGDYPVAISPLQRCFVRAIKRAGVKPIRIHDLRHSHASLLLNNGVNIVAVSKRLGHATVAQTLETYAHLMDETEEKMMETIEEIKKNDRKCSQNVLKSAQE